MSDQGRYSLRLPGYVSGVTREATDLSTWEQWLHLAELDVQEREREALADDPTPKELAALAAERDRLASDRDTIAQLHDEKAAARDRAGLRRDVAGSVRDRRARSQEQDRDVAFPDRFSAGEDRDLAAGDRGDSHDDRRRAREAREQAAASRESAAADRDRAAQEAAEQGREVAALRAALEGRQVIGQAQGLLMAGHKLSPRSAFAVLTGLAKERDCELRDAAAQLVAAACAGDSARVDQAVRRVDHSSPTEPAPQ